MDNILETTMKGEEDRRFQTMATMIISFVTQRFDTVEKGGTKGRLKNGKAEITQLRYKL